jgi:transcriptional regulator with XRE-family HTH domain
MVSDTGHGGTDLGRRIREHRKQAGLTMEETAERAGMAASYLAYLETSPDAAPTSAALARLAAALGTSTHSITGAGLDLPPGRQLADQRPIMTTLSEAECLAFLGTGGVGRFLFGADRGPVAVPVNYRMLGADIIFRTGEETSLAAAVAPQPVSFEVDHLDDALREGWSVLASGHAHVVSEAAELAEVTALGVTPWAGGTKPTYIRIAPTTLTGRQIRASA